VCGAPPPWRPAVESGQRGPARHRTALHECFSGIRMHVVICVNLRNLRIISSEAVGGDRPSAMRMERRRNRRLRRFHRFPSSPRKLLGDPHAHRYLRKSVKSAVHQFGGGGGCTVGDADGTAKKPQITQIHRFPSLTGMLLEGPQHLVICENLRNLRIISPERWVGIDRRRCGWNGEETADYADSTDSPPRPESSSGIRMHVVICVNL
jgi:hypothetical protein